MMTASGCEGWFRSRSILRWMSRLRSTSGVSLSWPRAQRGQRVEHQSIDLETLAQRPFAAARCPLRRNADLVDAGLAWRRLDAFDQLRHLPLENIRRPDEVGPKGDEQVAVIACVLRAGSGEHYQ